MARCRPEGTVFPFEGPKYCGFKMNGTNFPRVLQHQDFLRVNLLSASFFSINSHKTGEKQHYSICQSCQKK